MKRNISRVCQQENRNQSKKEGKRNKEQIKDDLANLPTATSPALILGLTNAHRKLSDYYYKFDESPFYTWAACT